MPAKKKTAGTAHGGSSSSSSSSVMKMDDDVTLFGPDPEGQRPDNENVLRFPKNPAPGHFAEQADDVLDVRKVLSWWTICCVYLGYAVMGSLGVLRGARDLLLVWLGVFDRVGEKVRPGWVSLYDRRQFFFLRYMYGTVRDTFERPVQACAGPHVIVKDRKVVGYDRPIPLETETDCVNLGSYNYLGFAATSGPITEKVHDAIDRLGAAAASSAASAGYTSALRELEDLTAEFVGKPAALVVAMGFATNSSSIPALAGTKGTLILSDTLNHASIVTGARDSFAATIRTFRHNDVHDLEKVIRDSIVNGQPRTRRPWKRIVIIIEGIYSMEGELADLPAIVAVKKKYKCYLYLDEAHSIGAMGPHGRGVADYYGVSPDDIDVMMGTFTKSFGSVGGYVAGSKEMIAHLRAYSFGSMYSTAMSPPCAEQSLQALRAIMGRDGSTDGKDKIEALKANSNHFRQGLLEMGLMVFGAPDSPVVPMMVYHSALVAAFSREMLARGVAVVIVGFPVTPLLLSRVRFCISAGHTRDDLAYALCQIGELAEMTGLILRPVTRKAHRKNSTSYGKWIHLMPMAEQQKWRVQLMKEFRQFEAKAH